LDRGFRGLYHQSSDEAPDERSDQINCEFSELLIDSYASCRRLGISNRCKRQALALEKLRITPAAGFSVADWSANVIFIVVIGGIGSIEGPIVGTLVFFVLRFLLADYGAWYLITLGTIAVIIMVKAPDGIWGLVSQRFGIYFFPVRRQVHWQDRKQRSFHD